MKFCQKFAAVAAGPARNASRTGPRVRWFLGILAAACLAGTLPAKGQVFEIQGGSSTLYDAHGGSVQLYGENYTARASMGYFDHFRVGFSFLTQFHGYTMDMGDQSIPFNLPTDLFNHSFYFLGRGASADRKFGKDHLFLYAGLTSTGFFAPFLNVASAHSMTALAFYEHEFSPKLHFYSYNILSGRQTSIQSISWTPRKNLQLAASAGMGSNQPYGAVSAEYDRTWIKVLAGYVQSGREFQRIRVDNPVLSESDKGNLRVEVTPRSWLHLNYDRENYVSPDQKGLFPRAGVNGYSGAVNFAGFVIHGEKFDSHTDVGDSQAYSGGVRRSFFNRLDLSEDYFRSSQPHGVTSQSLVTTVREKLTRRITLSQYVSTGNGQTSISYGGTFFSNLFSFSAEYQTVYLPLAAGAQSQFKQVLVANLRVRLPHSIELNGMSDVSPTGKVRYTGYFSAFAYRGLGVAAPGAPAIGPGMYSYLIRGHVVDESGEPVRGAAVRVQGEIAFTNSEGEFLVRRKHGDECTFEVALSDFMVAGRYEVVKAPSKVKAVKDESAAMEEVVVKRLKSLPKRAEGFPEAVPGTVQDSQPGREELPITARKFNPLNLDAPVPLATKLPYNLPGGRGNAGTQKTAGGNSGGQPGCGGAAAGAARVATGSGANGCAVAADSWRVVDSSGPATASRPVPGAKRERECFGLAKQLGACEGPHRKLRVQARGKSTGGSAAHRVAKSGRPQPTVPGGELPAASRGDAALPARDVSSPARAASTK